MGSWEKLEDLYSDPGIVKSANELEILSYRLLHLLLQGNNVQLSQFVQLHSHRFHDHITSSDTTDQVWYAMRSREAFTEGRYAKAARFLSIYTEQYPSGIKDEARRSAAKSLGATLLYEIRLLQLRAMCTGF